MSALGYIVEIPEAVRKAGLDAQLVYCTQKKHAAKEALIRQINDEPDVLKKLVAEIQVWDDKYKYLLNVR